MKRILITGLAILMCVSTLWGCGEEKKVADFSGINSVCELATLKCFYHNVARAEQDAEGFWSFLNVGYKKMWTEYSGIVELGVDVSKVKISEPDKNGVVTVTMPKAELLSVDFDENSLTEPLTDTGFLTSITKEEETTALAAAQENMEATAKADSALLQQAENRAKNMIEGYVKNVGDLIGETYTVEWKEAE